MKALWRLGRGTVAEVREALSAKERIPAYTTVMTLLGRLAAKAAVQVDRQAQPFVYEPVLARESILRKRLREFLHDVFDDDSGSLVQHLVDDESLSRDDLARLRAHLDEGEDA